MLTKLRPSLLGLLSIAMLTLAIIALAAPSAKAGSYQWSGPPTAGTNGWSFSESGGGWNMWGTRCESLAATIPVGGYCALNWSGPPANLDAVDGEVSGTYRQANFNFEQRGIVECNGTTTIQGTTTVDTFNRTWPDMCNGITIQLINAGGAGQAVSAASQWFDATNFRITLGDPHWPVFNILSGDAGWHGTGGACVRYGFGDAGSGLDATALVRLADGATYDNPSYASGGMTTGVFQNDRNCVGLPAPGTGTWTYEARAVDKSGNYSATPFNVSFDISGPNQSTGFVHGSSTQNQRPTMVVNVDDPHSGLAAVSGTIDGSPVGLGTPGAGQWSITPAADLTHGSHTYVMTATDALGNVSTLTRTFTVADTTPPAVSVTAPAAAWRTTCTPISYTATDAGTGVWTMRVLESGSTIVDNFTRSSNVSAAHPGDASSTRNPCIVPTGSGSRSYTARAIDQAGNVGDAVGTFTIMYDVTGPGTTTTFGNGSSTEDQTPTMTTTIVDPHSGIATISATIDGAPATLVPTGGDNHDLTPSDDLTHGSHTYEIVTVDNLGNTTTLTRTFTVVDTTAPAVSVVEPSTAWRSTCAPVDYTATDASSGVWTMQLLEAGVTPVDAFTRSGIVSAAHPGDATSTRSLCVTPPASGTYTYTARGIDQAGNVGDAAAFTVNYDVTDPTLTPAITDGDSFETSLPTIDFAIADAHSGIDTIVATVDGDPVALEDLTTGSWRYRPAVDLVMGSHTIVVTVTDTVGNDTVSSRTFTIDDTTAPTISIDVNGDTTPRSTCAPISYTAEDAVSGIWTMEILVAGGDPIESVTRTTHVSAAHAGDLSHTREVCIPAPGTGTFTFTARAVDFSGNEVLSAPFTIEFDVDLPMVTTDLIDGTSFETHQPRFTFQGADLQTGIGGVGATVNGNSITVRELLPGSYEVAPTVDLELGVNRVVMSVTDGAGNTASVTRDINIVDRTNPTITVTAPDTGWHGACAPMTYGGSDAMSGVWSMRVTRTGGAIADAHRRTTARTAAIPGDLDIERSPCIDPPGSGTFTYTATVTDYSLNGATSAPFDVMFDIADPALSLDTVEGAEFNILRPSFTVTTSDAHSGIASIATTIDGALVPEIADDGASRTYEPADALALGAHTLRVVVNDQVGNTTSAVRSFTVVDEAEPALTLQLPDASSSTLRVNVTDGASGVNPDSWKVQINGLPIVAQGDATGITAVIPPLVNGAHQLTVSVEDMDGNRSTRVVTYNVDNGTGVFAITAEQTSAITVYDAPATADQGKTYAVRAIVALGGRPVEGVANVVKDGQTIASAMIEPSGAVTINVPVDDASPLQVVAPNAPGLAASLPMQVRGKVAPRDTTAPTLKLSVIQHKPGRLLRAGTIILRATSTEPGRVDVRMPNAKPVLAWINSGTSVTVRVRLTKPLIAQVRAAQKAKKKYVTIIVRAAATDAGGNRSKLRAYRLTVKL